MKSIASNGREPPLRVRCSTNARAIAGAIWVRNSFSVSAGEEPGGRQHLGQRLAHRHGQQIGIGLPGILEGVGSLLQPEDPRDRMWRVRWARRRPAC